VERGGWAAARKGPCKHPSGAKARCLCASYGTAEAVPLQNFIFGTAKAAPLQNFIFGTAKQLAEKLNTRAL
jgi:hypothetical protein